MANQQAILQDTERRILSIVAFAISQMDDDQLHQRHIVFPLFIAGFATARPDVKVQALDIIKSYEGTGIGQNTSKTQSSLLLYTRSRDE